MKLYTHHTFFDDDDDDGTLTEAPSRRLQSWRETRGVLYTQIWGIGVLVLLHFLTFRG